MTDVETKVFYLSSLCAWIATPHPHHLQREKSLQNALQKYLKEFLLHYLI